MGPGLGAAAIDGDGEVLVQADAQAQLQTALADPFELQLGLPLQVLVEPDAPDMRLGEVRDFGRGWVAVGGRPRRPAPDIRVLAVKLLLQCLEQRVQLQRAAAGRLEVAEGARALSVAGEVTAVKMRIAALERGQL